MNAPERPRPEMFFRSTAYALLWTLLAGVVLAVNPFGIKNWTAGESRDTYFKLAAPFYRIGAETEAVVVLVGDPALRAADETFPPSFSFFQALLNGLSDRGARAVFLDFEFVDQRPGGEKFAHFLEALADKSELPVILASGAKPGGPCAWSGETILPSLQQADVYKAAVYFPPDVSRVDYRYYPAIRVGCEQERRLSPAWAMYELRRGTPPSRLGTGMQDERMPPDQMVVRWGADPPPLMRRLAPLETKCCRERPQDRAEAAHRMIGLVTAELLRPILGNAPGTCEANYIPAVAASYLLPNAALGEEGERTLREAIEGKFVFVGGAFGGIHDFAESPVHGRVPGVMLHAMAFDNFVAVDRDVIVPWGEVAAGMTWDQGVMLLLIFVSTLIGRRRQKPRLWQLTAGVAALGLLVLVLVEYLRQDPVNWVAILAVGVFAFQPAVQTRIGAAAERLEASAARTNERLKRLGRAAPDTLSKISGSLKSSLAKRKETS